MVGSKARPPRTITPAVITTIGYDHVMMNAHINASYAGMLGCVNAGYVRYARTNLGVHMSNDASRVVTSGHVAPRGYRAVHP